MTVPALIMGDERRVHAGKAYDTHGRRRSLPARGIRILRRLLVTPANANETVTAPALIIGSERRVYADKAYDTHGRRRSLPARGIRDGIMRRARRAGL